MKPGDLVLFDPAMWEEVVRGRTAVVLDVRRNFFGMWEDDIEFDVLMDGAVVKGLLCGRGRVGIEILGLTINTHKEVT